MLIAVDTGGTKTLVGRFSADGKLEASKRFPTPKSIPAYLSQLRAVINELSGKQRPSIISMAIPGTIAPDGTLIWAGNLTWRNVNFAQLLAKSYPCPVIVENDANLAGLAETRSLKAIPRVSLYVTVSTGIGTGITVDGSIDPYFSQSEGGRIVLEYDGALRPWETFASGSAIVKRYGKLASEIHNQRAWYQIAKNIARGLIVLAPVIRPDVIIIGGGVGTHFDKFEATLDDMLKEYLHRGIRPKLVQAKHPEEAVLYGCYHHAHDVTKR